MPNKLNNKISNLCSESMLNAVQRARAERRRCVRAKGSENFRIKTPRVTAMLLYAQGELCILVGRKRSREVEAQSEGCSKIWGERERESVTDRWIRLNKGRV